MGVGAGELGLRRRRARTRDTEEPGQAGPRSACPVGALGALRAGCVRARPCRQSALSLRPHNQRPGQSSEGTGTRPPADPAQRGCPVGILKGLEVVSEPPWVAPMA